MFQTFDGNKDNVQSNLSRFLLHCKIHDIKEENNGVLLLTSVDSNVFDRMQQESSPKLLSDLNFVELQNLLFKLYRPRQNFTLRGLYSTDLFSNKARTLRIFRITEKKSMQFW